MARPSTEMRRGRHAPLDRCMFCLARGVPRTEEHLVPRALGGRLTLRDAVCEPCRRTTGRLEQLTLDREFAVPKTLLALKRRRARGAGPSRMPPVVLEGEDVAATLTADAFPRRFWLPTFDGDAPRIGFVRCTLTLGQPARDATAAPPTLPDPAAYAWSIAKWAYALAVADLGLDGFDTQPLRDLMLFRRTDVFAFVRSAAPSTGPRPWLHDVAFDTREHGVVATLSLFASAGMVPYDILLTPPVAR